MAYFFARSSGSGGTDPDTLSDREFTLETPISGATDGVVTEWPDTFSTNHFINATSGNRPTYNTNQINGYAALQFDGTNDILACAAVSGSSVPRTIIAAIKQATGTIERTIVGSSGGDGGVHFDINTSGKLRFLRQNLAQEGISTTSIPSDTWCVVALKYDGSNKKFWINGVDAGGSGSWTGSFTAGRTLRIGATASIDYRFSGQMATVRSFSAALSDSDIEAASAFLMSRYGIT